MAGQLMVFVPQQFITILNFVNSSKIGWTRWHSFLPYSAKLGLRDFLFCSNRRHFQIIFKAIVKDAGLSREVKTPLKKCVHWKGEYL